MPILHPVGVVQLKPGNLVDAWGTYSDNQVELRAVWGAVFPGHVPNPPANPWDSHVPAFVQGTVGTTGQPGEYTWSIANVPGAVGQCQSNTFAVWYAREDKAEITKESSYFTGDSTGSGCSGSGSGSMVSGAAASAHMAQIAPQSYRLIPGTQRTAQAGHAAPSTEYVLSQPIHLEFDELRSSPSEMWWRSPRNRLNLIDWQLQIIRAGESQLAIVTLLQPTEPQISTRVWTCLAWNMMRPNLLAATNGTGSAGPALPFIIVEPAA